MHDAELFAPSLFNEKHETLQSNVQRKAFSPESARGYITLSRLYHSPLQAQSSLILIFLMAQLF